MAKRPLDPERVALLASQDYDSTSLVQKKAEIPFPACRHVLVIVAFLGFTVGYALRVNLSVALVTMVVDLPPSVNDSRILDTDCLPLTDVVTDSNTTSIPDAGEFYWTKSQQGIILGAFFYGYITSQLVAGRLAERFGGKHVFGTGILLTSVLTLLTPLAARSSYVALIVLRVVEGIGGGVMFPSVHAILSQWAPPYERTKLGTFIFTGSNIGTLLAMPLSGVLSYQLGWPSVFYVFGTLGCVWWLFWIFLMYDTPSKHPRISAAERDYIETAIHSERRAMNMPTPWLSMLTALPFWAIFVSHFAHNWGFYMLLTCLPQYMNDILHFDISSNGILSGLPYLASWIIANIGGQIADYVRRKHIARTVVVRKFVTCTGLLGPAVFLIVAGYSGCNRVLAVAMITVAVGFSGLVNAGCIVNHLDIAPRFAGTLIGLTNTAAGLPGILAPMAVTDLTEKKNTREQWLLIFYIAGAIYVVGAAVYALCAAGVEQDWAKSPVDTTAPPSEQPKDSGKEKPGLLDQVKFVNRPYNTA